MTLSIKDIYGTTLRFSFLHAFRVPTENVQADLLRIIWLNLSDRELDVREKNARNNMLDLST